jgi:hypothetical protein
MILPPLFMHNGLFEAIRLEQPAGVRSAASCIGYRSRSSFVISLSSASGTSAM